MRLLAALLFAGSVACGNVASPDAIDSMMPPGDATAPPGDATAPPDDATAPPGDAAPMCNATAPFGSPAPVMFLATTGLSVLRTPRLSANELTLYLDGGVGTNPVNLYVAHRNSVTDPFDMPKRVEAAYSAAGDGNASLSANEMNLWLASRPTTGEGYHLYVATRTSALVEFDAPRKADVVNADPTDATLSDAQPFVTADNEELWFISNRPPSVGSDLWRALRSGAGFGMPVRMAALSSSVSEEYPSLSADRLTIYINSTRPGTGVKGAVDIWRSHRGKVNDDFPAPVLVDELNTTGSDYATWLSADNCRLYGASNSSGSYQIFMATRRP